MTTKPMTLEEFLERLRKTPRDWQVTQGLIRRGNHWQCPITSLLDECAWRYDLIGSSIGLPHHLVRQIANAADDITGESELRARLLEACGLAPEVNP